MRVGLAIDLSPTGPSLWDGEDLQAAAFLALALGRSRLVRECVVVDAKGGDEARAPAPVVSLAEALERLDVVIEIGLRLEHSWCMAFEARGGRRVALLTANALWRDAESMVFDLPAGAAMAPGGHAEVWLWPGLATLCGSYAHYAMVSKVAVVPCLWSGQIIAHEAAAVGNRFAPQSGLRRIAILEPNRSCGATSHLPLLVCDVAFRQRPQAVGQVVAFGTEDLRAHPNFAEFLCSLELERQGRLVCAGTMAPPEVLGARAEVLVSHQAHRPYDFRLFEALYGGFALVHNSPVLGDCGYRFADYDPEDGARALLAALAGHNPAPAQAFLHTLSPENPTNIAAYEAALRRVANA